MFSKRLEELAHYLGGEVVGDPSVVITGLAGLDDAREGDITFLANPKYAAKVATTRASAVILSPGAERCGKNAIVMESPYLGFAKLLTLATTSPRVPLGVMEGAHISPTAVIGTEPSIYPGVYIGENVRIGDRVTLYPNVVIGDGVSIGDDVVLHAGVSIRKGCRIGNRVTIHDNTTIGSDGFGYAPEGDGHFKIPQIGIVIVEDDVEIGANCAIDRAALEATRIGRGTKIDNLVQIAHNCVIGENCIIVSQVGISGSTRLGNNVTLGGQVGVAGHLTIADRTMIAAKSGVMSSVERGVYGGIPILPHKEWLRSAALVAKLPEMKKRIADLERRLVSLQSATDETR
ncbi:MAG: UDP-3-O-(3-hydroxymyristoyl)glucosamine N-acyltransferase [Desulfuromonadia bacterium]